MKTVFLRALEADDKAAALRAAISEPEAARGKHRFEVDAASFAAVPNSPFAYWVSERLRRLFKGLPPFEADGRTVRQGLATSDDFRFVRCWWGVEPQRTGERWFPFAKGGSFAPFYSDLLLTVNWDNDGRELKAFAETTPGTTHWSRNIKSPEHYFRPGLTWPLRAARFGPVPLPRDAIFSVRGYAILASEAELLALGAIGNSAVFDYVFKVALGRFGFPEFIVGVLKKLPLPATLPATRRELATCARRAWSLKRSLDTRTDTSHAFTLPALLQVMGHTLAIRADAWADRVRAIETELAAIQTEVDESCFDLYGIDETDRRAIVESLAGTVDAAERDPDEGGDTEDEGAPESGADITNFAAELASWAVGVAFGRFDVRLATGARALPPEPEPFDALPVCSPAMLTGDDGLPLDHAPAGYQLTFPETGILVDDPGHPRDLTAAVRRVFEGVFGADADAWWDEIAALLDSKGNDLRTWLGSSFFEHHLKRHSKSRRKAPIVWQLRTPSGRYGVWLYAHRLTRDTFFQIQNDIVGPKLAHEERQLTSIEVSAGGSASAKERKEIAAQETFVEELRALVDELKRVTPLWIPTLDDGVGLTMAPLWRLVPQHKPWQNELKNNWDGLVVGRYDWAHLAMHLWPERVVPKCATDRSLAIAHGLEETFWVQGADGKWTARSTPTRSAEELVRERTSPAVKEALKSLLEAPTASAGNGRGPRGRAASAVAVGGAR